MRKSKYGNIKTHGFDSKAEYARWQELKLLEKAGKIKTLQRQVPICLDINNVKIGFYYADFVYLEKDQNGLWKGIYEDVKGVRTAVYRLKKKIVEGIWGIKIKEVSAKDLRVRRKP